ncbi:MAG: histidine phosphatase family protein [Candidatus Paceibacterales bacterium]
MPFFKNSVVLLRHGQTQWNLEKRTMGHLDSPLTEEGILRAKKAVKKLKSYNFDIVISSPLGRALETSKIIAKGLKISEIKTNPAFAERHLGVLQGRPKQESVQHFPYFWDADGRFIQNSEIPGGESLEEFLQRVQKGIEDLRLLSKTKNILVVAHDGVLHAIVGHVKRIQFSDVQKIYKFNYCDPIILD